MNEMQVKIRKNKLPAISATYEGDLARAVEYVRSIEDLLTDTPLNVQLMNATLNDAIDYIYKLYNNVNNLVAMAIMVENTIVFGNKVPFDVSGYRLRADPGRAVLPQWRIHAGADRGAGDD